MTGWDEKIKKSFKYCGENVQIGHYNIFANPQEIILHDNVRIDPFCLITSRLEVDSWTHICSHTVLGGGVSQQIKLGIWCFIGYGSKLFTASEDYSGEFGPVNENYGNNKIYRSDITFKDYSGIASDVMIFPSSKDDRELILPEGTLIGAKSLWCGSKKLSSWNIYVGNPLKHFKERNDEKVINFSEDENFYKK